jgi:ribosomal protein S12 methylthiotransferase accessory factor
MPATSVTTVEAGYDLVVAIDGGWHPGEEDALNRAAVAVRTGLLPVHLELGTAVVGPLVTPGRPGCHACAEVRRAAAAEDRALFSSFRERFRQGSELRRPWLTSLAADTVAALVVAEVIAFACEPARLRTRDALLRVLLRSLEVRRHRFLPDPLCADCGRLTDDTPDAARISIRSLRKLGPHTYRVRSLTAEKRRLLELYADPETGMVAQILKDPNNLFANVSARIGLAERLETGYGRGLDFETSQVAAIAEALERFGGVRPGAKRTVVRGSFSQLSDKALDPTTLGLPSEEQYAHPRSPYVRYSPDLVLNWVWAYSFALQEPILVPELHAYYRLSRRGPDPPYAYEISNGCAIGTCLEEAILHGLLEVAERDAFLMTWYARLPAPRIEYGSAHDSSLGLMAERLERMTGYRVRAFNTTLEQGVPSFWVMAVDEQERKDTARFLCAAGSGLDPEKALANAIQELGPMVQVLPTRYLQERERALRMLEDDDLVVQMEDHSLLYCLPEAWPRLSFLYDSDRSQTFEEAFPDFYAQPGTMDLAEDLNRVVGRYLESDLDVIVVDQTTQEHEAGGLRCVKVLVPGTQTMTFGNLGRRTQGIRRLHSLPVKLGYRSLPLTEAELNLQPHPFP